MHNLKPWAGALYLPNRFFMRTRKEIEQDRARKDILMLEVLLDIRELLIKQKPKRPYTKRAVEK